MNKLQLHTFPEVLLLGMLLLLPITILGETGLNNTQKYIPEVNSHLPNLELDNPLSITSGGVYENLVINTKNYNVPAIKIQTSEPVIIRNSVISGPGDLIVNTTGNAKIEISNNYIWGRNPDYAGRQQGRSVKVENVDYFIFNNNYTEQTGGVRVKTLTGSADTTVWMQGNIHKDLTSLVSNGTGNPGRAGYDLNQDQGGEWNRQMVILNNVSTPAGSMAPRIIYNIMENNKYNPDNVSSTEDLINIFGSSGENMGNPILVARNFLRGSHGNEPFNNYRAFYGTAIIMDASQETGGDFGYVMIFDNYATYIQNAGIAVSSGHHVEVFNNKIVNPLIGEDGKVIRGFYDLCGYLWAWKAENPVANTNYYSNTFYNHSTKNKEPGNYGKNHFWGPDCFKNDNSCHSNVNLSDTITHDYVVGMYCDFFNILKENEIPLGPDWGPGTELLDVNLTTCENIIDPTDIGEVCLCDNELVHIYPNPADDLVKVDLAQGQFNHIMIVNIFGQIVGHKSIDPTDSSHEIAIDNLPAGIYHIIFSGKDQKVTKKIFKR